MAFLVVGSWGRNHYAAMPIGTDNCPGVVNVTATLSTLSHLNATVKVEDLAASGFSIFDISFNWYAAIGFVITLLVGTVLSYVLSPAPDQVKLNPNLLSPVIRHFVEYEQAPMHELPVLQKEKS